MIHLIKMMEKKAPIKKKKKAAAAEDEDDNKSAQLQELQSMAQQLIDVILNMIVSNHMMLYAFAFELRKVDKENKFTRRFLEGRGLPAILVDIIEENKWNIEGMNMKTNYQMTIGNGDYYMQPDEENYCHIANKNAATANICDKVKFILTSDGFVIKFREGMQALYLQTEIDEVADGESCLIFWNPSFNRNQQSNLWVLNPQNSENGDEKQDKSCSFHLEKSYGEKNPRMVTDNDYMK